ncbi:MAG: hypothetical protein U5K38_09260 [Woeseiaceae bacterium]|nr:hypothetical protein [Woeseiaceae bacterium]
MSPHACRSGIVPDSRCHALRRAGAERAGARVQGRSRRSQAHLQYISVDGFEGSLGNVPLGEVETQVVNIDVDYHLTDRLTLVAGIPFVRERYLGPFDHDPLALDPPRTDVPNVDTGDWNTGFQDFHLGIRYLLKESPQFIIEPFAVAGIPSNDYPFFGHAAIGRNRAQLDIGSSFIYRPPISDAWYRLNLSYVFVEKTLGVSINHLNAHAEAGYFFAARRCPADCSCCTATAVASISRWTLPRRPSAPTRCGTSTTAS